MASSCTTTTSTSASSLTEYQLFELIRYVNESFTCPITLEKLNSPQITNCGHTFEASSLKGLTHCPFDRTPLTGSRSNVFVKELINLKMTVIFLALKKQADDFLCSLDREPLFDAIKLPCGHSFNKFSLIKHSKTSKCPIDLKGFDIEKLEADHETRKLVQERYPIYVEKIRLFNEGLSSILLETNLDNRRGYEREILRTSSCLISKKLMKTPVTADCWHTFESTELNEDSACPNHRQKQKINNLIKNYMAKDFIEFLQTASSKNGALEIKEKDLKGVFLFLSSNTTLQKINEIALYLRMIKPHNCEIGADFEFKEKSFRDAKTKLTEIEGLTDLSEEIPILYIR